jgi:hypothetical protein
MNRTFLRPAVFTLFLAALTFCSAISADAMQLPDPPTGCVGGPALNGWYGILIAGGATSGGGKYLSGAVNFNGACGLSGNNINGGVGTVVGNTSVTGTYGQNSDGTYDLTLNLANQTTPQTYTIGVSSSGTKAVGIESDGSAVATIDIESQLTTLTGGYSNSLLSGTYAVSCSGSGVDLNYVTFDGNGNLSGVDPYDNGGSQGNSPYSGTYSVVSDGTFSGSLTGSYSQYTLTGVIDNGVTEIQYTYYQSGNGEVIACSGRQAPSASLIGYYGMVVGGTATNGLGGEEVLSGSVYFNGSGSLTVTNLQGGINSQYGTTSATGTYATNSDNTVTITMNVAGQSTPQTYIVGVSEGGNEAVGIETDGAAAANIDFQSQLVATGTTYTNASLNGTYAAVCSGAEVDLNYVTFDGQGNQNGVDPYDNGTYGDNPYTGTYSVNSDGTFAGSFSGAYANYLMTGVIDNATAEIEYTYDYIGSGGVVSCVGNSTYGPIGTSPVAAIPTFSPAPGAYNGNQTVMLSDTTPGATIYYTTNGVTPTTSSLVYSTPVTVTPSTTIEAIAVASEYNNSAIAAGTYFYTATLPTAANPTFNPLPGTYNSTQNVTLSDTTPGAVIHCTTDNTTPTASSPVCTTVTVSATTEIQAFAAATGYNNSAVVNGIYTITPTAANPTFNPLPGSYNSTQNVTLSDTTPGAVIHCTTDNTMPTASSPVCTTVTVSATTTIQAFAVATGYNNSAVVNGLYTITPTAANPTFNPLPGTYNSTQNVTLSDTSPGAVIHCTTDNTTPTASSPVCTTVTVSSTTTIQAIAVATGYNNSAVVSSLYTITPTAANPIFNPLPGTYNSTQNVTLSDTSPGAVVHCTTNNTTPTASSPVCTTVTVSATTTIQAIAVATGYNNSAVVSGLYTITPTVATPTFNPLPGTYNSTQSVTLSDTTPGAAIHCTTNNTTPTAASPVCTTLTVSSTTTIQAIAVATGYNNSVVDTGTYTITIISPIVVNLGSYYNVYAIASPGSWPQGGGIDGFNYNTYDSSTLGASATYKGLVFPLGPVNTVDAVNNKTVTVSGAQYGLLYLVGTAVDGAQLNQTVTVNYTDGSNSTFTQSFSDWGWSQNYPGETVVTSASNRIGPFGNIYNETTNLYGYTFSLAAGKTVASVKLPGSRDVVILGIGLGSVNGVNNLAGYYNVYGIASSGNAPVSGGFDNDGNSYNSGLLGTSLSYQSHTFSLGAANALDASSNNTVTVPAGQYGQLFLLGAAVNGAQGNQTVTAYYTDGSNTTFTQNFSDWVSSQKYSGETVVTTTANRIGPGGVVNNTAVNVYGYTFTLNSGKTLSSLKLPSNRNVAFIAMGLAAPVAQPTPIVPYIQVNSGSWQQISSTTVAFGSSLNLGPQPVSGGSWSWKGPNGYTSTQRQINNIPLSFGSNVFVATYTNPSGAQSTQVFTITVNFGAIGVGRLTRDCRGELGGHTCALTEIAPRIANR